MEETGELPRHKYSWFARLYIDPETWRAFKRVAKQQQVPATVLCAVLVRNYTMRPFRLEWLPRDTTGDKP